MATERTPGTCSEITRSPESSSVSTKFCTRSIVVPSRRRPVELQAGLAGSRPRCLHSFQGRAAATPYRQRSPQATGGGQMRRSRWGHKCTLPALAIALASLAALPAGTATAAGTGTISGTTWKELNRDGIRQPDEPVLTEQQVYLFDGAGNYVAVAYSDSAGRYAFGGLADGEYRVSYASPSWWALRDDWVPTTTGSIYPRVSVALSGTATADFGWRAIVRSTDLAAPISTYIGPNGLRVESFDDVVPAKDIYDVVMRGTVGPEAQYVKIRFDYGTSASSTGRRRSSR